MAGLVRKIHTESPDKGYRRIRDDLAHYYGAPVNDKRALRICRSLGVRSTIKYARHGCTRRASDPQYLAEIVLNHQFCAEKPNEVMLRATAKADTPEAAEAMLRPLVAQVQDMLGDVVYGVDVGSLEEVVSALLKERDLTLSAAESCTGGLIAKRMTDLPGASAVFRGGVVSYTDAVKSGVLGVPEDVLAEYGAVSEPAARAMAEGCRKICGSDLAVSVTGVAGPDSDGRGTEVGTVFIALASGEGVICRKFSCGKGRGRDRVRTSAAQYAFDMIRRSLLGLPQEP